MTLRNLPCATLAALILLSCSSSMKGNDTRSAGSVYLGTSVEPTVAQWPDGVLISATVRTTSPVTGAAVSARVVAPDGSETTYRLNDSGQQGDIRGSDGLYAIQIQDFPLNGEYRVIMNATDGNGAAVIGGMETARRSGDTESRAVQTAPRFNLSATQTFQVSDWQFGSPIPPGKTSDLTLSENGPAGAVITWTAPGASGNSGTAERYDLRYSDAPISTVQDWEAASPVEDMPPPSSSGHLESHRIKDDTLTGFYYFVLRTRNNAGELSDLSNSVVIRFGPHDDESTH